MDFFFCIISLIQYENNINKLTRIKVHYNEENNSFISKMFKFFSLLEF